MTLFVHLLTMAAIFVHSTWGCCAHQSHPVCNVGNTTCDSCSTTARDCCGSEQTEQLKESPGLKSLVFFTSPQATCAAFRQKGLVGHGYQSQQPVSHECSHANCTWSAAPESQSGAVLVMLRSVVGIGNIECALVVSRALLLGSEIGTPSFLTGIAQPKLSVRSHLAHCVLLI